MLEMVKQTTPKGNPQAVLDAIDSIGWNDNLPWSDKEFLMNIGDVKGAILDSVIDQYQPHVGTHLSAHFHAGLMTHICMHVS